MAQKYGDIFSLMLGNRLVVVLNGLDAIQEALVKHSTAFAGRPQLHSFKLANRGGNGLVLGNYSPQWRLIRKISASAMQKFAKDKSNVEEKLLKECHRLILCFKQQKDKPIDPLLTFKYATGNIILSALFGVNLSYQDQTLGRVLHLSESFGKAITSNSRVDFFPFLEYLPNKSLSDLVSLMKETFDLVAEMFMKNKDTYTEGHVRNVADSFFNVLEKETMKERANKPVPEDNHEIASLLSDTQIISAMADLFGGAFDTSSVTLTWALAYLIKYPEIQRQLQDELDHVVGRERLPILDDLASLPLLQATVYELLRVTSLAPLSVPRSTIKETKIRDFVIPKDTTVFVNLWSVHRDPGIWKDPHVFNPWRFLNRAGELIDPKSFGGFLPFSAGRRKCPGESLALRTIPILLAALFHSFRFSQEGLSDEYQGINLEGTYGLSLTPETFYMRIEER